MEICYAIVKFTKREIHFYNYQNLIWKVKEKNQVNLLLTKSD